LVIKPRCLRSARRTWQRLQRVRRLFMWLVPSLPERIWSIWALRKDRDHSGLSWQYGPWQRPLSRNQTRLRVLRQISMCWRRLGIFTLLYSTLLYPNRPYCAKPDLIWSPENWRRGILTLLYPIAPYPTTPYGTALHRTVLRQTYLDATLLWSLASQCRGILALLLPYLTKPDQAALELHQTAPDLHQE